jgi:hypothetical protein
MHWCVKCSIIIIGLIIFFIVGFMTMEYQCKRTWQGNYVEIGRITSPDSRYDAIVLKDSSVERSVLVYIEPTGQKISNFEADRFVARKVYGLSLRWTKPKLLEIHYQKADITRFYNIWTSEGFGPMMQVIEITLVKDGDEEMDLLHD